MNTVTIIHPRLQHLGMTTSNTDAMLNWYRTVLGMSLVHRTSAATGDQKSAPNLMAAWVSNDEANHRLAFVQLPGLSADPDRGHHQRLQHFAFEYRNLDDLLGTYARLKEQGILPVLCTDAGAQTAFYYEDPDHNSVELNVDNYGDSGRPPNICETPRSLLRIRWANMSIPTNWLPPARWEHRHGNCTSAPGSANFLPRCLTILGFFSKRHIQL